MKKILFVINSEIFIRNYIDTGIIENFDKDQKYKVYILANNELKNKIKRYNFKNVKFYKYKSKYLIKYQRILNVIMWRYKKKSTSFLFRSKYFGFSLRSFINFKFLKNFNQRIKFFLFNFIFSKNPFWFLYKKKILKLSLNYNLEKIIKKISPNTIIYPTQAYELIGRDICLIGKKLKIKSIFVIDNWDNLSSKSIMYEKPDILCVWSKQTKKHAIKIQNFKSKQVKIIGTPRFKYYIKKNKLLKSQFSSPYILFLGQFLPFDEAGIVHKLDNFLSNKYSNKIKLIYRPHPWRQNEDKINFKKLKCTIIDPQVTHQYNKKIKKINFQPNLSYYPSLIKNSIFVISGLTTMLLEASLLKKKVLCLAFDDNTSEISQFDVYNNLEHLKGINNLTNLKLCFKYENIFKDFENILNKKNYIKKNFDENLKNFIAFDKNFEKELKKIIN